MPGAPLTIILFVIMAVAMAQGVWRRRRTTALGLVLVLGTFTFGIAVHSVHHLSEPEKATECLVFSASQHVSGTLTAPVTFTRHCWPSGQHLPIILMCQPLSSAFELTCHALFHLCLPSASWPSLFPISTLCELCSRD
jgi:hypothetical protein